MSVKVILARHGDSVAYEKIEEDQDIKRQDRNSKLSQLGTSKAQKLAQQVSIYRPDAMIVSPYLRARQTGDIVAEFNPLFPNVVEDLREIRRIVDGHSIYSQLNLDYKRWRGETIRKADLSARFHKKDESHGEFLSRLTQIKYWILQEFDGQTVVVIGHSQANSMFISSCLLGDKPAPQKLFEYFNRYFMSHAAYTILTWDYRKGWQMKEEDFNITKHLK